MKTKLLPGTGIVGNKVVVNVVDMVTLSMLADRIERVITNHKAIYDYHALPYDKRKDENGNKIECPAELKVSDEDLNNVAVFLRKCAGSFAKSTAFDAESNDEIVDCSNEEPEYHLNNAIGTRENPRMYDQE